VQLAIVDPDVRGPQLLHPRVHRPLAVRIVGHQHRETPARMLFQERVRHDTRLRDIAPRGDCAGDEVGWHEWFPRQNPVSGYVPAAADARVPAGTGSSTEPPGVRKATATPAATIAAPPTMTAGVSASPRIAAASSAAETGSM